MEELTAKSELKILINPELLLAKAILNPSCTRCNDSGYVISLDSANRAVAKACSCLALRKKVNLFNSAELPSQYWDADFENFQTTDLPKINAAIKYTKNHLKNYTQGKFNKGLLFYGKPGTGKTKLASVVVKHFTLNLGVACRFIEFVQLLNEIKRGYDTGLAESEFLTPLVEVDVLVVDELGKGRGSDWENSILDQIVSKRYFAQKTTYFTTNYLVKSNRENAAEWLLQNRLGPRIYSRLHEMTDFIDMDSKDFRTEPTGIVQI